jgi:hypothetical protein
MNFHLKSIRLFVKSMWFTANFFFYMRLSGYPGQDKRMESYTVEPVPKSIILEPALAVFRLTPYKTVCS